MSAVWTGLAHVVGHLGRRRAELWRSSGGERVLVVAPHPDDEVGCAGTLLLHRGAGDEIHVAHATDGRRSRASGLEPEAVASERRGEARAAARALGATGHWLGLPEGDWQDSALHRALTDLLRELGPRVVYAPSPIDFHPEHIRVAAVLAGALAAEGRADLSLRIYPVQVPLTPVLANLVAPISPVVEALAGVVRCYRTQLGSIERCARMKRYAGALFGRRGPIEEFWAIDARAYARVASQARETVAVGPFRGVRRRPFVDPMAYIVGLRARRALRAVALGG